MEKVILIAGGTGLIGKYLIPFLKEKGHEVRVLTRNRKAKNGSDMFYWNPVQREIDEKALKGVQVIINLSGENLAVRWTNKTKERLVLSRTQPAEFLFSLREDLPVLEQYISASGINCYPLENTDTLYPEEAAYGTDFLSEIVEHWEKSAGKFSEYCTCTILRISIVITPEGGAMEKMRQPMRYGLQSAVGSGNQYMNWIHIRDLVEMFNFVIDHKLQGAFNANGGYDTNKDLTVALAASMGKKVWLPNIPSWVMKLVFGEMSEMLLKGIRASNKKIIEKGFRFEYEKLNDALK